MATNLQFHNNVTAFLIAELLGSLGWLLLLLLWRGLLLPSLPLLLLECWWGWLALT